MHTVRFPLPEPRISAAYDRSRPGLFRSLPRGRGATVAILAGLCLCVFAQAYTSLRGKSLTYDEIAYIGAGYSYVKTGDYRLNREQPPLMKLLIGAALLPLDPRLPTDDESWTDADRGNTQWLFGERFLIHDNPNGEQLVLAARLPVVFVTMLLVVVAYLFARDLYGRHAGLLAATLCAFSPSLLAHGRLATTDLGLACFVLLSIHTYHRFVQAPSAGRLVLAGFALGLALLAKFTGVLMLPLLGLWAVVLPLLRHRADGGDPEGPPHDMPDLTRALARSVAEAAAIAAIALMVVSIAYLTPGRPWIYFQEMGQVSVNVHHTYASYFRGAFHEGGVWYYFIAAFLLKTPLAFLILLVVRTGADIWRPTGSTIARVLIFTTIAVWFAIVSWRAFQIGVRYVLPAYPLLFVYAAGIVATPLFAHRWIRTATAVLIAWFIGSSLNAHPHYLPYFNALAGGADNGIEWLDDSNIDWGQDLILLRTFIEETDARGVRYTPMGEYDPAFYGIDAERVRPSVSLRELSSATPAPGIYAVSVHLLNRIRADASAAVDPLTDLTPLAILGHTIYVYNIR